MSDTVSIKFDEFSKIRILDPTQYDVSSKLKEECKEFTSKISEFNDIIGVFQDLLSSKAQQIEREKLKTIGLRLQVESEVIHRKAMQVQIQSLIDERQAELDRHDSDVKL
ncbi:hypothetical protein BATDEDRAFT_25770 [Batrachochytrium dendrobatidis JAM81]|uniref:Intraflagellar transport protein 20 n=1 Tax=Batrachochytrium dendrobatidis (strain JAM81 / FGSC 10211) TaxID=684364 RepID=F4P5K0_BATDJ|nr:uncharacterized protein BATDEDRAFT_25770 [Batrachochytrium dendrobatidis JAM81]EGF79433.1 hypothetical protein BATDEDRAFT_25770 [Batrachochytrium dendrobatidis JAM81]|eukprot:XP_006679875.1 hypothetical protein BATDEDRAFT_25770 [Batrachochytrium dendrobatidis JAM81]